MVIKTIFLIAFFAIMIVVGFLFRKSATDVNGFVLANRNVGPWFTAFAYGTSYFSAVIFIGYAGQFGWKFGLASTWIGIGNTIIGSYLAWRLLGRRTRLMTQELKSSTMPDFFQKRFQSKGLKLISAIIIFIFLIPYTASLYNGLSRLFDMAFGIKYIYCIIFMAVLTGIYVIVGGYMATAANNFIQGIIMLFGIVAVVISVLNGQGGLSNAVVNLSKIPVEGSNLNGALVSILGPDPIALIGVVILTSLGTWGLPQMVQKFYSIKNEHDIKTGTIISTIFALVVAGGSYFLGGFGRLFENVVEKKGDQIIFDSIIPQMLSNLGDILIGVVVILVLSASMSTLSSLVLTSGSTITLDFINPLKKGNLSEKSKMLIMRILIVFFIAISAGIAIIQANSSVTFIADLMGISWGALAGAFLAPFLYGLYWKRTSKVACYVSFFVGVGIMLINLFCRNYLPTLLKSPINAGVIAMFAGLILVPVISLLSKKPEGDDKERIDKIFNCYSKKVYVPAKEALEEEN
jgi:SSS family solute:Na+ symporter